MKSFKLRLLVRGACTFVPQTRDGNAVERMHVLLPDARRGLGNGVPLHRAVLRFNLGDLADLKVSGPAASSALILPLSGVDLHFESSESEKRLEVEGFDPKSDNDPSQGSPPSLRSFAWVAPIEIAAAKRGFRGAGRVHPELIADTLERPFSDFLAARLLLREGNVFSFDGEEMKRFVWRFRPFEAEAERSDHRQMVASIVAVERKFTEAPGVELVGTMFGRGGQEAFRFKLAPGTTLEDDDGLPVVQVELMNEEGDLILDMASPQLTQLGVARPQDRIFEFLYRLSPTPPPEGERPIPVADVEFTRPGGGSAGGSPPCSPGRTGLQLIGT